MRLKFGELILSLTIFNIKEIFTDLILANEGISQYIVELKSQQS